MNTQQKSEVLSALGNPLRLKILGLLTQTEQLSITEIANQLEFKGNEKSTVNAAMKVLYSNDIVVMHGEKRNGRTYSINKSKISEVMGALESLCN